MKTYHIYRNSKGDLKVIKQGWCWCAFLFNFIWAFSKKLFGIGTAVLMTFIVIVFLRDLSNLLNGSKFIVVMIIPIALGLRGSSIYEGKLKKKDYKFVDIITARSPAMAMNYWLEKRVQAAG